MINRAIIFIFLLLVSTAYLFSAYPLRAQEKMDGLNITVSPSVIELTNLPGAKVQSRFRIRNNLDTPIRVQLSISKLTSNGNSDALQPTEITSDDEFSHWVIFDQASISARPKEWTDVKFTIAIPKTASFGYYYAIRIKQIPTENVSTNTATKLIGEVLIPILLDIQRDGATANASIITFKPESFINEYLPVNFITQIKNTGNIHIKPRGNIFIRGMSGKDIGILYVNSESGSILPDNKRIFTSSWIEGFFVRTPVMEDGSPKLDKQHKPITQLQINWDKLTQFRIGKYTANELVVFDNGKHDVALEATTAFWVIPYTLIGSVLVAVIVIVIIVRFLIKIYIKRELKKYKNNK